VSSIPSHASNFSTLDINQVDGYFLRKKKYLTANSRGYKEYLGNQLIVSKLE